MPPTSCPMTRGGCAWKGCAWWIPLNQSGSEGVCAVFKIAIELENLRKLKVNQMESEEKEQKEKKILAEEHMKEMRRERDETASKGGV